jgi:hypothetical protein
LSHQHIYFPTLLRHYAIALTRHAIITPLPLTLTLLTLLIITIIDAITLLRHYAITPLLRH